jgi:hypothetical protein
MGRGYPAGHENDPVATPTAGARYRAVADVTAPRGCGSRGCNEATASSP